MEVASRQKNIIWMIPISIVGIFVPFASIVTGIIMVYFIYMLAVAVRSSYAWVYAILAFIPLLSLIGLLHINSKATKVLQANGLRVGLMGTRMEDFDNYQ